jgi:RimJ/RimL family protein N-acetyltransferase
MYPGIPTKYLKEEKMIEGKKISLRLFEESDLDESVRYFGRVDNRGLENIQLSHEVNRRKNFQNDGYWGKENGALCIVDKENNPVGYIAFFVPFKKPTRSALEIGFGIFRPENWGKGYTSDAVSLFVPYLFETHTVERIQAMTSPDNIGSQKVLEKNGFTFEGVLRKAIIFRGKPADVKIYSILREESNALEDVMV